MKKESKGMEVLHHAVEVRVAKILFLQRIFSIIFSTDRKYHEATIALDKDNSVANSKIQKKRRLIRGHY